MADKIKISGLTIKDELNPDLWRSGGVGLHDRVYQALKRIADEFVEYLKIDIMYRDVLLVGTQANYSWNKTSDLDLYLIFDYDELQGENKWIDILFNSKADQFNELYDIEILGYDFKIHVAYSVDEVNAEAIFSLIDNSWVRKPDTKDRPELNENRIRNKIKYYMDFIEKIDEIQDHEKRFKVAQELKNKIIEASKEEFSEDYIIYRSLKASGKMKDLIDIIIESYGEKISLKEQSQYHYNPNNIIIF